MLNADLSFSFAQAGFEVKWTIKVSHVNKTVYMNASSHDFSEEKLWTLWKACLYGKQEQRPL